MGAPYIKGPVVLVFKNSNRKNAKTKMKIFKNKNVDVVNEKKMPGVPENAVVLELAVGKSFIDIYKHKYKL
jgi:hypothetical protein|tara:strand:+ start:700 stop:912 length:213 start_codon:yes stop_codon:yes gene_type:complete